MTRMLAVTGAGLAQIEPRGGAGEIWRATLLKPDADLRIAVCDPADRSVLFTGSRGGGVQRSTDAGGTWEALDLPETDVFSLAASPADGALYAGTEPSRLFRSRDRGETWHELTALQDIPSRDRWSFPPRPWTSHVRWIAPHPTDASLLLAGIELGGVMRTTDGGESFADHPEGAVADVHALAWHPEHHDRGYEAGGGGAARTDDRGATWRRRDAGRDRSYCWGLAVDPLDRDRWYVSAASDAGRAHGAGASDAAVYRSEGREGWARIGAGLPDPLDRFPYALAATSGHLFVGLSDGSIFVSTDHGDSFERIPFEGPNDVSLRGLRHLFPW